MAQQRSAAWLLSFTLAGRLLANGDSEVLARSKSKAAAGRREAEAAMVETVHVPLIRQAQALVGLHSTTDVVIELPAHSEGDSPAQLSLVWEVSGVVSQRRSTLSVELDDAPIFSARLAEYGETRSVQIALPGAAAGFHVLRLRARLLSEDDPCHSPYDRELWLRILPESGVGYRRLKIPPQEGGIAALFAEWQRSQPEVALIPPSLLDPGSLAAYLHADRLLSSAGLRVTRRARLTEGPSLQLWVAPSPSPRAAPAPPLLGVVQRHGPTLLVLCENTRDLATLLSELVRHSLLSRCPERECLIPRSPQRAERADAQAAGDSQTAASAGEAASGSVVSRLAQHGFPQGYTARGPGWHGLRWSFQRPAHWEVLADPEVQLHITASTGHELDRLASALTLRLGDRPLLSVSPADLGTQPSVLRVPIPPELWQKDSWSFTVEVVLRSTQTDRCRAADDPTLWLTLSAESGVFVRKRDRSQAGTLAGLLRRDAALPAHVLFHPSLRWSSAASLAAILRPLPALNSLGVVSRSSDCGGLCVAAQELPEAPRFPLALLPIAGESHWYDRTGALQLPLIPAKDSVYLHYTGPATPPGPPGPATEVLHVLFPPHYAGDSRLGSPDYGAFGAQQALYTGGAWLSLAPPARLAERIPRSPQPQAPAGSKSPRLRSLIDLGLSALSLLLLVSLIAGLTIAIRRSRRKAAAKQS